MPSSFATTVAVPARADRDRDAAVMGYTLDQLDRGANVRALQELLGHASLTTTGRYLHIARAKVQEEHRKAHLGYGAPLK